MTQTLAAIPAPVNFLKPSDMRLGRKVWNISFNFTIADKFYAGEVYADGEICLMCNGRNLPESHKTAWREALSKAGIDLIRAAHKRVATIAHVMRKATTVRIQRQARIDATSGNPSNASAYLANSAQYHAYCASYRRALAWAAHSRVTCHIEMHAAIMAGKVWAQSLKAGGIFYGTVGQARRWYNRADLRALFSASAKMHLPALWDETGRRIIGVGLIDTYCWIGRVKAVPVLLSLD